MMGAMELSHWLASITARAADSGQLHINRRSNIVGQTGALKLHMSGPAPEPLPFTIEQAGAHPAFDLPNTTLALASRRFDVPFRRSRHGARRRKRWPARAWS